MNQILNELPAMASITAPIEFLPAEAAAEGQKPKKPSVKFDAYAGGIITLNYWGPTAFELSGIKAAKSPKILFNHNQGIGHLTEISINPGIKAKGVIDMGDTDDDARKVIETSKGDDPYPWECSVGIYPERNGYKFIAEGETATVNGKELKGPFYHILKGTVKEISIVYIGAEPKNQVSIAAKGANMPELKTAPEGANGNQPAQASGADSVKPKTNHDDGMAAARIAEANAMKTAEKERIDWIKGNVKDVELAAACIADGSTIAEAGRKALAKIQTDKPIFNDNANKAPGAIIKTRSANAKAIGLALARTCGLKNEDRYDDQTREEADKMRGIGLKAAYMQAAALAGYSGSILTDSIEDVFRYVNGAKASSTIDMPGILQATMQDFVIQGYNKQDQNWRRFTVIGTAADFKSVKALRPNLNGLFQEIGNDGEVANASMTETQYTNQAKHMGLKLVVTSKTVRDDSLDVISRAPAMLGENGAQTITHEIWKKIATSYATFFTAAKGNYISGSTALVDATGYGLAEAAMDAFKDSEGNPIIVEGGIILVAPGKYAAAHDLWKPPTTSSTNAYSGRFEPIKCRQISNANYLNTPLQWILSVDTLKTGTGIVMARFLDGQETPMIEQGVVANGNDGVFYSAKFGVGVSMYDELAAVLSKGAA